MLILGVGIYFLVKLRFFFIVHPYKTVRKAFASGFDKKSRRALSLALAGTLGVGNIVGVAYGISVGGAGCLFWIFISGIFSSVIKYCESTLGANFGADGRGGMMYVIAKTAGKLGRALGTSYSVLCLLLALFMGAALQTRSVAESAYAALGIRQYAFAIIFAALVFITVIGGAKKIENATSAVIPIATIVYIVICVAVIINGAENLSDVLACIFREAFNFRSAAGGVSVFLASSSMREGFARGLLSNEAGAGTSSIAQSRHETLHPAKAGLFGICEVFFDTTLLCTLTGLAILTSGATISRSAIATLVSAFATALGIFSPTVLFILIFAFAYSTVVCWYFYATEALVFLFDRERSTLFTVLFFAFLLFGALVPESILVPIVDSILFLMSLLTLFTLIKNSERIVFLSEQYGLLKSKHSDMR